MLGIFILQKKKLFTNKPDWPERLHHYDQVIEGKPAGQTSPSWPVSKRSILWHTALWSVDELSEKFQNKKIFQNILEGGGE